MTRRTWATNEQRAWLLLKAKDFVAARTEGTLPEWRPKMYQEWFDQFPEPAPTTEQLGKAEGDVAKAKKVLADKRKTQLNNWFQNHNRGTAGNGNNNKILPLNKKPQKKLQLWQVYLRVHGERVTPIINKAWEETDAGEAGSRNHLAFITTKAIELLRQESQEVRDDVAKERERIFSEGDDDGDQDISNINARQNAVDNLPRTLQVYLDNVQKLTGWVGAVIVGGPDPRTACFKTFNYHVGKTLNAGNRFDQIAESWPDLEKAFGTFVPKCYDDNILLKLHGELVADSDRPRTPEDDGDTPDQAGSSKHDVDNNKGEEERSSSPSEAAPSNVNTFEEDRERQIRQNEALLQSLGLENPVQRPAKQTRRPQPRPIVAPVPASDRQLRPRTQSDVPAAEGEASTVAEEASPSSSGTTSSTSPDSSPISQSAVQEETAPSQTPQSVSSDPPTDRTVSSPIVPPATPPASQPRQEEGTISSSTPQAVPINPSADSAPTTPASPPAAETPHDDEPTGSSSPQVDSTNPPADSAPTTPASPPAAETPHDDEPTGSSSPQVDSTNPPEGGVTTASDSPASASEAIAPGTAAPPEWWQTAYEHLYECCDQAKWMVLCERWLTHERIMGFCDGSAPNRLPTKNRPEEIKRWISRGRLYHKPPTVDCAKSFGEEWRAWWVGMQPEWRGESAWPLPQTIPASGDVDWGVLRRGGCNAIFLAILALTWWWSACEEGSGEQQKVEDAMSEVTWVLSAMHNLLGTKRSSDGESPNSKRSR